MELEGRRFEAGLTDLGGQGRDHWPYGSALVAGSGVRGNRRIGATDEALIAVPVDSGPASAG